jgi:hypothetical protein
VCFGVHEQSTISCGDGGVYMMVRGMLSERQNCIAGRHVTLI